MSEEVPLLHMLVMNPMRNHSLECAEVGDAFVLHYDRAIGADFPGDLRLARHQVERLSACLTDWLQRHPAPPPFRAGDIVKHGPTGETWLLIVDEVQGKVVPGGWPDTRADAGDCTMVEATTDEDRLSRLLQTAQPTCGHSAKLTAIAQLKAMGLDQFGRSTACLEDALLEKIDMTSRPVEE